MFNCYLSSNNPAFPLSLSSPIHHLNFQLDSICLCSQWYLPIHFTSDYFNRPLSIFLTNISLNKYFRVLTLDILQ